MSTNPTVLLLGEALVDEFVDQHIAGGAPLNVARSLAALGLSALLGARLGQGDAAGALILQSLRQFGLDEQALQFDASHGSGRVSIVESAGTHRFVIADDVAWDHLDTAALLPLLQAQRPAVVYFGSLAQRTVVARERYAALLDAARDQGCLRYLDLNLREGSASAELAAHCLAHADWVKLNDEELARLMDWFGLPGDAGLLASAHAAAFGAAARQLAERFGLQRLVLTRGAHGYAVYDAQGQVLAEGGGMAVAKLVDTVGAGDAFSAMLLAASLQGLPIELAASLANRFAAAVCGLRGPVSAEQSFYLPWCAALQAAPQRSAA